jgi:DNA-directed RNA polymerase subunit RPC12/RpoP
MPMYESYCDRRAREVTLTLSISEREKWRIRCPRCGGKSLRPLLSTFVSQTSRKS